MWNTQKKENKKGTIVICFYPEHHQSGFRVGLQVFINGELQDVDRVGDELILFLDSPVGGKFHTFILTKKGKYTLVRGDIIFTYLDPEDYPSFIREIRSNLQKAIEIYNCLKTSPICYQSVDGEWRKIEKNGEGYEKNN